GAKPCISNMPLSVSMTYWRTNMVAGSMSRKPFRRCGTIDVFFFSSIGVSPVWTDSLSITWTIKVQSSKFAHITLTFEPRTLNFYEDFLRDSRAAAKISYSHSRGPNVASIRQTSPTDCVSKVANSGYSRICPLFRFGGWLAMPCGEQLD